MNKLVRTLLLLLVCGQCLIVVPALPARADVPSGDVGTFGRPPMPSEDPFGPRPRDWYWRPDCTPRWRENQQMATDIFFFITSCAMFLLDN